MIAIVVTIPFGVTWLVAGQVFAGAVYYFYALYLVGKVTGYSRWTLVKDLMPYVVFSVVALVPSVQLARYVSNAWILLTAQLVLSGGIYLLLNWLMKSKIQADVLDYVFGRFRRK